MRTVEDEVDSVSCVVGAPMGSPTPVPSDMTAPAEWLGIGGGGGDTPELSELVGTGSGATAAPEVRCNAATAAAPVRADVADDPWSWCWGACHGGYVHCRYAPSAQYWTARLQEESFLAVHQWCWRRWWQS